MNAIRGQLRVIGEFWTRVETASPLFDLWPIMRMAAARNDHGQRIFIVVTQPILGPARADKESPAAVVSGASINPVIAVVDDDHPFSRALSRLLRSHGYDVTAFSSGAEFLCALTECRPDVVLLDVEMPGINGLDVQRHLSASNPQLPIIFITAHTDDQVGELTLSRGAVAFLPKPVPGEKLFAAIRAALNPRD